MTVVHSALYEGSVRHRRHHPRENHFTYKHGMLYLDLDELPALLDREPLYSSGRANLAWFRRADYLGDRAVPLKQAVYARVAEASGLELTGPVRMLTQVRTLGYVFNPVTFYYCFDEAGETLLAIVAEITNTPWHERHAYVLTRTSADLAGDVQRFRFPKQFHVSPFLPMDILHDWRFATPGESLHVHMEDVHDGRTVLDATLTLRRHPIGKHTLTAALLKHPLRTLKVTTGIYFQALRLWWKRIPFHRHPDPH